MAVQFPQLVQDLILDQDSFVEATFREVTSVDGQLWKRLTIRPVLIKADSNLQFTFFDGVQEVARNYEYSSAADQVATVLALPAKSIQVVTTIETVRVQFSKKGRAIVHRQRHTPESSIPLDLAHDRQKAYLISDSRPVPFLQAIGVMTADGRVRADQRRKFRQINEFLRLIDETGEIDRSGDPALRVVDLGCGSAALTFATYYYLNEIKSIPATMVGVDTKGHLMARLNQTAKDLGWDGLTFETTRIVEYDTGNYAPDIVLALHACDTATDEALARAIRWRSKLIFSAPCCHHHLQAQLAKSALPAPFQPVARHGILRERQGDILTDAFRAQILRLMGYRAEVLEFIPIEHTPKNLMIRARHTQAPPAQSLVDEYLQMKSYWGVTPYLETLVQDLLQPILAFSNPVSTVFVS